MKTECLSCGQWHDLTPTAMLAAILGFQDGNMQTVGRSGVTSLCLMDAITPERVAYLEFRYPGRKIAATLARYDEAV